MCRGLILLAELEKRYRQASKSKHLFLKYFQYNHRVSKKMTQHFVVTLLQSLSLNTKIAVLEFINYQK